MNTLFHLTDEQRATLAAAGWIVHNIFGIEQWVHPVTKAFYKEQEVFVFLPTKAAEGRS